MCLICIVLGLTVIPSTRSTNVGHWIDWLGAVLLAPAVAGILYGVSIMKSAGVGSPLVLGSIGVGVVLLVIWVRWELKTPAPLVNLRALAKPQMRTLMIIVFAAGIAPLSALQLYTVLIALTPADMPVGIGLSATMFGLVSLGGAIATFFLTPIAGWLAGKYGGASAALVGGLLFVVIYLLFLTPAAGGTPRWSSSVLRRARSRTHSWSPVSTTCSSNGCLLKTRVNS